MLAKALLEEGTRKDGPWNFGPGSDSTQTVESVVRTFTRCWNGNSRKKAKWEIDPGPHPHEAHTLALDCSRTKSELGWHSVLSFTETINMTAEWYCRHLAGESARAICQTQLARYQELAARPSIPEVHAAIPEVHAAALPHLARRAPTPVPAGAMRA
jgi:CDP-glucose 4,6-dehydratase